MYRPSDSPGGRRSMACALVSALLFSAIALRADDFAMPGPSETRSSDARMAWWREARFGMFIHWSLFSVPEGTWKGKQTGGLGEWIMHDEKIPVADYRALAARFNPTQFDADKWVSIAQAAGMKYIIITAKHHDGFAMFDSKANPFNIVDATPYHHDPIRDLADACRNCGMKLGFYYSQDQDWTAPGGAALGGHWDKAQDGSFAGYLDQKSIPQIRELLTNYQPAPAVLWFDTPTSDMTPALASVIDSLVKEHPNLIINNRLGGGFSGDTETPEQVIPPSGYPRDWETCMTVNDTWGYKSFDTDFKSTTTLLRNLIDIASKGGNYLLNVGPTPEGVIPQPEVDRLLTMGTWLKVNGEAIYGTKASPFATQLPWGRATQKPGRLYLSVFDWPTDGVLQVPIANEGVTATLLAQPGTALLVTSSPDGLRISVPASCPDPVASVVCLDLHGPLRLAVKSSAAAR